MKRSPESYALQHTIDLVRTPYVVEVLDRLHHGEQPESPISSEAEAFEAAIRTLVSTGLIRASSSANVHAGQCSGTAFALTSLGAKAAAILVELRRP